MIDKILDRIAQKIANKIDKKTIERVEVFDLKNGDIICFLHPGCLGENAVPFREAAKKRFPNNEVIILEDGMRFSTISTDGQKQQCSHKCGCCEKETEESSPPASSNELMEIADLTLELTRLSQDECKHLSIENFAPALFRGLLSSLVATKAGKS